MQSNRRELGVEGTLNPGSIRIDTFHPADHAAYASLNRAWLVKYGLLEESDERQLVDPDGEILAIGGQIFVARRDGEVVGTCAVVPHGDDAELLKLTVAPSAQGLGLGRRLVQACLLYAQELGSRRMVLLSNTMLVPALRVYEGLGFRHAPLPSDRMYQTANVYMELELDPSPAT